MLHSDRLDAAVDAATQFHALADSIYDKRDPRLCKSLEMCALVQEKQGKYLGAEKSLFRCYTILFITIGVEYRDTQRYFEEMLNIMLRRGDDATAEKFALTNYTMAVLHCTMQPTMAIKTCWRRGRTSQL